MATATKAQLYAEFNELLDDLFSVGYRAELSLLTGSPSNGRNWQLVEVGEHRGHKDPEDFRRVLGETKGEALATLRALRSGLALGVKLAGKVTA